MSIKRITFFTVSNYVVLILSVFQGIMLAKILTPDSMGLFSQIKLYLSYLLLLNPGFINGLIILLPTNTESERENLKNQVFTVTSAIFLGSSLILFILYFITNNIIILYLGLILPFISVKEVFGFYLRGISDFKKYSVFILIASVMQFLLIVSLSLKSGVNGAVAGFLLSMIVILIAGIVLSGGVKPERIVSEKLKALFNSGFIIYLNGMYLQLINSGERIILSFILLKEEFAVYSVGIFLLSIFDLFPSAFMQYLLPDFIKNTRKYDDKTIQDTAGLITVILTVFIVSGIIMFDCFLLKIIPYYESSLTIFKILSATSLFQIYNYIVYNKYISTGNLKRVFPLQGFGILLLAVFLSAYIIISKMNVNLIYVALAMTAVKTIYLCATSVYFKMDSGISLFSIKSSLLLFLSIILILSASFFSGWHLIIFIAFYIFLYYRKVIKWLKIIY